jgi:hypothetical protein
VTKKILHRGDGELGGGTVPLGQMDLLVIEKWKGWE